MSDTALGALYQALHTTLTGAGGVWGSQAYAGVAPTKIDRPYCLYAVVGGGELNATKHADAEFIIAVRCIADDMAQSMAGAATISEALNDQGEREVSGGVSGGADWYIHTITQERVIHLIEKWEGVQNVYHNGHQFRVRMESK